MEGRDMTDLTHEEVIERELADPEFRHEYIRLLRVEIATLRRACKSALGYVDDAYSPEAERLARRLRKVLNMPALEE